MPTCFVIQPFDQGKYDKLYDDVFQTAIQEAGLEPYRVDRDPAVAVPIEDIEQRIRDADICFAEISEDNPNVWYELGFAVASRKPVVLACSDKRTTHFPFDVQHRQIIRYTSESPRDFEQLKAEISERLRALYEKGMRLAQISQLSPVAPTHGLSQHEVVALISTAEHQDSPEDALGTYAIREGMRRAGFTDIATTLALRGLKAKELVDYISDTDINGNEFFLYHVTEPGMAWLDTNQDRLLLRHQDPGENGQKFDDFPEDADLPF